MAGGERKNADFALVTALAAGATVEAAAAHAKVSPATVYRRLQQPEFRTRVEEVRRETLERTTAQLSATGLQAVTTLRNLLNADSEHVRLGAARGILELGTRLRESLELEQRLAALEAASGMQGGQR